MRVLSPSELLEALRTGGFDSLIGCGESAEVDFKARPYALRSIAGNRELAKDVSAFANASGGLIILGARTERDPSYATDMVVEIVPFDQAQLHVEQYEAVVESWVYPALVLTVQFYPSADDRTRGLGAIVVGSLERPQHPALVRRAYEDERRRATGVLVGYFVRTGARNRPASIEELHARFSGGDLAIELSNRLSSVEAGLAMVQEAVRSGTGPVAGPISDDEFSARREDSLREAGLDQERMLFLLGALPQQRLEVPDIFGGPGSRISRLLSEPPAIRPEVGFGLFSGSETRIVSAKYRMASASDRLLAIWRDGPLLFAASAGPSFLCWGTSRRERPGEIAINQLALVEAVYDFCALAESLYEDLPCGPITLLAEFRGLNPSGLVHVLLSGPIGGSGGRRLPRRKAPEPDWTGKTLRSSPAGAGAAAFRLLELVYAWFGLDSGSIPYTGTADGEPVIDPEQIRKIG